MSNTKHENYMDDLNAWADQYQSAIDHGVFEDAPKPASPSPQTADTSFFGPVDSDPTDGPTDADAEYWQRLHEASAGMGGYVDPFEAFKKSQKAKAETEIQLENTGDVKSDSAKIAQAIAQSPNPVKPGSIGMDQDIHDPGSLGQTFSTEQLTQLAELKVQLHDLENKLNAFDVEGKAVRGLEGKISGLKSRINNMSDEMGHSLPD